MQISKKTRLVGLIVVVIFLVGTTISGGIYLIINHFNKTNAIIETYTSGDQPEPPVVYLPCVFDIEVNNPEYGITSMTTVNLYTNASPNTATINATPNDGYRVAYWELNGEIISTDEECTLTAIAVGRFTVTVFFEPIPVINIQVNNENFGKILYNNALITSTELIEDIDQIENLYAIANSNYAFLYWLDLATGQRYTANPLSFTVTQNTTITAVFGSAMADGVAVSVESLAGETSAIGEARITGYSNIDGIEYVHFSAVAYKGYSFVGWYIMGEESPISTQLSADLSLAQVQNKIVIARFEPQFNQDNTNFETDN